MPDKPRRLLLLLLSLLLWAAVAQSDVLGDGDDDLLTGPSASSLITVSDGTIFVTAKHTGVLLGGSACVRAALVTQANTVMQLGADTSPDVWAAKNFDSTTDCAVGTFTTTWTTLIWRHGGGNIELYINGALAQSTASGNATTVANTMLLLWDNATANAQFPGLVAQVAFYDTALSANQIAAYGQSFVQWLLPSGATAVVDFNHCTHGVSTDTYVFKDRTGNGNDFTASDGANNTGMTCAGATGMVAMGGMQ